MGSFIRIYTRHTRGEWLQQIHHVMGRKIYTNFSSQADSLRFHTGVHFGPHSIWKPQVSHLYVLVFIKSPPHFPIETNFVTVNQNGFSICLNCLEYELGYATKNVYLQYFHRQCELIQKLYSSWIFASWFVSVQITIELKWHLVYLYWFFWEISVKQCLLIYC